MNPKNEKIIYGTGTLVISSLLLNGCQLGEETSTDTSEGEISGEAKILEYPPAHRLHLDDTECGGLINLHTSDNGQGQKVNVPPGCFAEVRINHNFSCKANYSPTVEKSDEYGTSRETWDLSIDPIINGTKKGTTTVKCERVNPKEKEVNDPVILPTPTLRPELNTSLSNLPQATAFLDVEITKIELPSDFDKLLTHYQNEGLSDVLISDKLLQLTGERPIMTDEGEFIGISGIDRNGKRIHFISEVNTSNRTEKNWYLVTTDLKYIKEDKEYGIPKHLEGSTRPPVALRKELRNSNNHPKGRPQVM